MNLHVLSASSIAGLTCVSYTRTLVLLLFLQQSQPLHLPQLLIARRRPCLGRLLMKTSLWYIVIWSVATHGRERVRQITPGADQHGPGREWYPLVPQNDQHR